MLATVISHTLSWAALSTLLVMLPGVPLAYLLARREFPGKQILSTLIGLPMVLPPTAVGYLLLKLLADRGILGRDTLGFDLNILLNWKGVVLACMVMSAPLIIRTARVAFEEVDPRLEDMARTMGYRPIATFFLFTLPLAWRGLLAACILGFTRALGEFGASVIVAGNIPGRTQSLSSAIYTAQQSGDDQLANTLLFTALAIGFLAIFLTEWLLRPATEVPTTR